jgi:cytochrome c biogenesis protein CcmG/thiol:disulfide interchange protein DsbE
MEIKDIATDGLEGQELIAAPVVLRRSRKRSITIFVIVSLLNVGLLALLWTQLLTPRTTSSSSTATAPSQFTNDPSITGFIASPLLGQHAPDFKLLALSATGSGSQFHLADLKGRPAIINFWSSSCAPCQD